MKGKKEGVERAAERFGCEAESSRNWELKKEKKQKIERESGEERPNGQKREKLRRRNEMRWSSRRNRESNGGGQGRFGQAIQKPWERSPERLAGGESKRKAACGHFLRF